MSEASYRESQFTGSPVQSIIINDFIAPEASCTKKKPDNYSENNKLSVAAGSTVCVAIFVQIK